MLTTLEFVLIFLAASVGVAAQARKFHLPPLLGYLLAGIVIGPHAVGLVPNTAETRYLADFGVVFLMFSIGLEFNLPQLMAMRPQAQVTDHVGGHRFSLAHPPPCA